MKSKLLAVLCIVLLCGSSLLVTISAIANVGDSDELEWAIANGSSTGSAPPADGGSFWLLMVPPIQAALKNSK